MTARASTVEVPTRNTERLSVNVSQTTAKTLRELANAKSTTVTEIIRQAVAVLKLLEDEQREGAEIQLIRKSDDMVQRLRLI
jgi:predicted DNA-binding helix-hairpin-helix protein